LSKEKSEEASKDGKKKNKKDKKSKKDEEKNDKKPEPNMLRVFALNAPEWLFIIFGCIASVVSGAVQPAFSIILSKAVAVRIL
jgi:ATP-binding cassette subfamily B (MDR/TAP) protein 1